MKFEGNDKDDIKVIPNGKTNKNATKDDESTKALKLDSLDRDQPTANENNEKTDSTKKNDGKVDDIYGPMGNNYVNKVADYDYSRIGIDVTKKTDKAKCQQGYYMKVHSIGQLTDDGRVFEDSIEDDAEQPPLFYLGNHDIIKCLEIAYPQLREGEFAHITCPAFYAYGGAVQ